MATAADVDLVRTVSTTDRQTVGHGHAVDAGLPPQGDEKRLDQRPRLPFVPCIQRGLNLGDREVIVGSATWLVADGADDTLRHRGNQQEGDAPTHLPGHQIAVKSPFWRSRREPRTEAGPHVRTRGLEGRPQAADDECEQQGDGGSGQHGEIHFGTERDRFPTANRQIGSEIID